MIETRAVTDVVGSTLAAVAQICARELQKRCTQVRQSRTIGEFIVTSGVSEIRRRFAPAATSSPRSPDSHTDSAPDATPTVDDVASMPVADYDLLTSAQVVELFDTLDLEVVRTVLDYEMTHRRRRLVVEAAQRLLAP
jgi:hypothetical protein